VSRGVKYTSGLDPRINRQGCSLFILAEHKPPVYDKAGITLITASVRRPFADVLNQHIHSCNQLTSILAKLEASAAGADDAMLLDPAGCVAETNATHLFFVKAGVVRTPTTKACPEGITRAAVLELCRAHGIPHGVADMTRDAALAADEAFCTGTMGELAPVTRIDNVTFNRGQPGPMCQRLSELYRELTMKESEGTLVI
jgi:branched-chain amino acid aminotransferase